MLTNKITKLVLAAILVLAHPACTLKLSAAESDKVFSQVGDQGLDLAELLDEDAFGDSSDIAAEMEAESEYSNDITLQDIARTIHWKEYALYTAYYTGKQTCQFNGYYKNADEGNWKYNNVISKGNVASQFLFQVGGPKRGLVKGTPINKLTINTVLACFNLAIEDNVYNVQRTDWPYRVVAEN